MLLPFYNKNYIEAGLDEAGRGCLAGPVVAAAVILPKNYQHQWLNDSKQLSALQRLELRAEIIKDALDYCIAEASNEEIDQINILNSSILAMHRAVDGLQLKPEHLLIDGNRFKPYPMVPHTCIIKGDSKFLSIAAASILAKTYRDELMENLAETFPVYHWHKNAGYPTIFHRKAIIEHGITKHHRLTFRGVLVNE